MSTEWNMSVGGNPYERISDIAKRLDVKPAPKWETGRDRLTMRGLDGQDYDVFDVVAALIDRMDRHKAAGPEADLRAAVAALLTLLKYDFPLGGGAYSQSGHAIAIDRATVFLDDIRKRYGWKFDIDVSGQPAPKKETAP